MTSGQLLLFVSIAVLIFLLIKMVNKTKNDPRFVRDDRNPYRRYCRQCGQQQDTWDSFGHCYWVSHGRIRDENCNCHNVVGKDSWI